MGDRRIARRLIVAVALLFAAGRLAFAEGGPAWLTSMSPQVPGTGDQDPLAMRVLADQTILVAAKDRSGVSCVRYDASGAVVSTSTVYPPFAPVAVAISAFGELFVLAQGATHAGDFWTMKYDGLTGVAAWPAPAVFDGAGSLTDVPAAIGLDAVGDVIVTGAAHNGTDYDWATLKYAGESGAVLWGPILMNRSGTSADTPALLGIDAAGDVVISGFSQAGAAPYDWMTTKYSGASGAAIWGPVVFDGAAHGSDFPDALAFDAAGNVIVSGESASSSGDNDWATVKYAAASGTVMWGPILFSGPGGGDDKPSSVAVDGRGDVVVTGRAWSGTSFDWATVKYAGADGSILWGPIPFTLTGSSEDFPLRVAIDGAGDVVVAGYSLLAHYEWTTLKYAGADGSVAWGPKVYSGSVVGDDFTRALALDGTGNAIVAGVSGSGSGNDAVIVEYAAATGSEVWGPAAFTGAGNAGAFGSRIAADAAGNVFVAGSQGGLTSAQDIDWFVVKYDGTTGAVLWGPVRFDGATHEDDRAVALAVTPGGNLVVTGSTSHAGDFDWATVEYDGGTGAIVWGPVYFDGGGGSIDTPVALALTPSGDVVITGYSYGGDLAGSPTVEYAGASGAVVWGPILFDGAPTAVAVDASGNAFVTGSHFNGSDDDWSTVKYKSSDGSILWGPVAYDGPVSGSSDTPLALAVTPSGDLAVTGIQSGPQAGADFDWATLEYSGASGSVLWGPETFGGTASRRDQPTAVAVDASGNVFVTGVAINLAPADAPGFIDVNIDWATFKYDAATGTPLWGPVEEDGTAHLEDAPLAMAVDSDGDAIVAGYLTGASDTFDYSAVKYLSSNGHPLWRTAGYDGGGLDRALSLVAVGADAILTGESGASVVTMRFTEALSIRNFQLPSAACGEPYAASLAARNGTPPYSWSVVSGSLPDGVQLAASGALSGPASGEGIAAFRVRVTDAASATTERDFMLAVFPGGGVAITATEDPVCPGASTTLSVAGSWDSYQWLPGGETAPSISVSPSEASVYGVVVTDSTGCTHRGARTVGVGIADAPAPAVALDECVPAAAGGLAAATPAHACSAYAWTVTGGTLDSGQGTPSITFTSGAAGTLMTVQVTETDSLGAQASSQARVQVDFADVASGSPFHDYVCAIGRAGITAGCGGGDYCPDAPVSRAQMAVFLLKSEHGADYSPPPCAGVFADVPCPGAFTDWIEQLAAEQITGGCGGGNYCPAAAVTRAQMAVFLLKTLLGPSYVPPAASGVFGDVPVGSFAADWIEDLYGRQITGGCSSSPLLYCPANPNTRAQMAVFLDKTFGFP